jgi:hypothetical protein
MAPMAHAYNPTYLGSSRRSYSSKPAQANTSQNPSSKKKNQEKGLVEWLKV